MSKEAKKKVLRDFDAGLPPSTTINQQDFKEIEIKKHNLPYTLEELERNIKDNLNRQQALDLELFKYFYILFKFKELYIGDETLERYIKSTFNITKKYFYLRVNAYRMLEEHKKTDILLSGVGLKKLQVLTQLDIEQQKEYLPKINDMSLSQLQKVKNEYSSPRATRQVIKRIELSKSDFKFLNTYAEKNDLSFIEAIKKAVSLLKGDTVTR